MSQVWASQVIEHDLAGLAASITASNVALAPAAELVDLSVILKAAGDRH
jgi:ribonuclease PH